MTTLFWAPLPLMLILGCLLGCGGDNSITPNDANQIPTITIEKLSSEKVEERIVDGVRRGEKISWRLNAIPAPKTDLVVLVGDSLVIIKKSENYSEVFTDTIYGGSIEIRSLPTVYIAGEGLVVDRESEKIPKSINTRGGHGIPKDFDFPFYKVGDLSRILCEGCGIDVLPILDDGPPSAMTATTSPAAGSEVAPEANLTITLDEAVDAVTINGTAAAGFGKTWTLNLAGLNLPAGSATLNIGWTNKDGTAGAGATVTFTIKAEADRTAPKIVSGSVRNNDIDVDPADLNADGITFSFSEDVKEGGIISISTEQWGALNWLADWSTNSVTIFPAKGAELVNETTYEIKVFTEDGAGNRLVATISFTTRLKE